MPALSEVPIIVRKLLQLVLVQVPALDEPGAELLVLQEGGVED